MAILGTIREVHVRADVPSFKPIPIFDDLGTVAIGSFALNLIISVARSSYIGISYAALGGSIITLGSSTFLTTVVTNIFLNVFKLGMKAVYRRFYSNNVDLNKILDADFNNFIKSLDTKGLKVIALVFFIQTSPLSLAAIMLISAKLVAVTVLPYFLKLTIWSPTRLKSMAQHSFNIAICNIRLIRIERQRIPIKRVQILITELLKTLPNMQRNISKVLAISFNCAAVPLLFFDHSFFFPFTIINICLGALAMKQIKEERERILALDNKIAGYRRDIQELNESIERDQENLTQDIRNLNNYLDIWEDPRVIEPVDVPELNEPIEAPVPNENPIDERENNFITETVQNYLNDAAVSQVEKNELIENLRDLDPELFGKIARLGILEILFKKEANPAYHLPHFFRVFTMQNFQTRFHALSVEERNQLKRLINDENGPEAPNLRAVWTDIRAESFRLIQGNRGFLAQIERARAAQLARN
jgi:hypothetical protein